MGWTNPSNKDFDRFRNSLNSFIGHWEKLGIQLVSGSNKKVGLCLNVDDAVIWLVGARFVRPKTACLVYYFQGCDRWFGQVNLAPTVEV